MTPVTIAAAILLMCVPMNAMQVQRMPESDNPAASLNQAQVASGKQTFASNCAFCHGVTARGGAQGGPDLTQSGLVRADVNGKQLAAFLKVGRPDKGMPAFNLTDDKVQSIAAFLHSEILATAQRNAFGNEVMVGDAAAGEAFFKGAGKCSGCHSVSGDLKGIGSKYPPAVLQGRIVLPIGHGGYPGFAPSEPPRIKVTVAEPGGKTTSGLLVFLSDYAVTVLGTTGERRTFPRHGELPKIVTEDPLQAHLDRQLTLTDKEMHDLTAYLATLK